MKLLAFLLIFGSSHAYFQECYVTPCTRDVIIVVDGSNSMQTSTYISQEINVITKLVYGWTFSRTQVRLALVGAYFGNEFSGVDYYVDSSTVEKRLQQYRYSSIQYGLFDGNFNTTIRFLDERYVGTKAVYGPRDNVQKRIVIFTAHSGPADIASTKSKLAQFASLGYKVTLVGLGVTEDVYKTTVYHKFVSIPFAHLISISQSVVDTIIEDGICFYDDGVPTPKPQICTTSTTTTTTTQKTTTTTKSGSNTVKTTTTPVPRPTQPPFPVGDYQECSCTLPNLYLDIVFVVDTSSGMGEGLFLVKAEISTLVGQMTLDPSQQKRVQVGLVKYSEKAEIVFHPDDYTDEDEFNDDLWDDPRFEKTENVDEVNLDLGLEKAEKLLSEMRSGVKKVIVVYAASFNDEGEHDPQKVADRIRASGHSIITVAYVEDEAKEVVMSLGEIASKRMNFTSYRDGLLVEEIEDALCQVNCYCPSGWHQLKLNDRKYGECMFSTILDASWTPTKYECSALSREHTGNGHLVYVNSELKNNFLNQWYIDNWSEEEKQTPNYFIGYYYNKTLSQFMWVNGVTNNPYTNWKSGHPNLNIGECSKAELVENTKTEFKWESVDCSIGEGRGLCQEAACDTDFYCDPAR